MSDDSMIAAYKALAKVQKAVLKATKDGKNPAFNSKYATLAEVLETVRDPLADNGFALIQDPDTDMANSTVGVVTRLIHESGVELKSARLSAPLKKEFTRDKIELPPSVQQIGSLVTYLRRYSLCAFLSVAVEDDDGNAVSEIGKGAAPSVPPSNPPAPATPPPAPRKSALTGEVLDTPEAITRHKAAAEKSKVTPETPKVTAPTPATGGGAPDAPPSVPWPKHAGLVAEMNTSAMAPWMLDGYLRGTFGEPRIKKPMLTGNITIDMLGAEIVERLLRPENWRMVRERIAAAADSPLD